jgi:hypothetical protein
MDNVADGTELEKKALIGKLCDSEETEKRVKEHQELLLLHKQVKEREQNIQSLE